MVAFGRKLGNACIGGAVVFLDGDLGAGKTTISRGVLQSFGHQGAVKSPTYTLVEPYQFDGQTLYHFDLYRLADPEELEYIGIRDYFAESNALCLVEWPARGVGYLPTPDVKVAVTVSGEGRMLHCTAATERGQNIIKSLGG
ncbi:tRNA (adenosine(37)-N6)-threonylcarbamoyltransferase complex ATPase subunit type 1 TsaE [Porticoccaceae bacterium LTM1]|nr:tRNA (adenosine(37)-N6)-threonylcarbamoyltransferase complex ATPase subunit type 1 TsaE [Porticoccaceae bacterium LTM1]